MQVEASSRLKKTETKRSSHIIHHTKDSRFAMKVDVRESTKTAESESLSISLPLFRNLYDTKGQTKKGKRATTPIQSTV